MKKSALILLILTLITSGIRVFASEKEKEAFTLEKKQTSSLEMSYERFGLGREDKAFDSGEKYSILAVQEPSPGEQPSAHKFSISFSYGAGFSETKTLLSWSQEVFYESALYNINYATRKGNYFGFGLGFQFSSNLGIELGGLFGSKNMTADYDASIPHPLLFNSPREADAQDRLKISENALFLNVVLFVPIKRLSLNFFGGPAYFMTSIDLVKAITVAESYPYDTISISCQKGNIKQNVFGGNAGVAFDFFLSPNFALFIKGHYFLGKANFNPSEEIPALSLSLVGGQAGGGIKLRF